MTKMNLAGIMMSKTSLKLMRMAELTQDINIALAIRCDVNYASPNIALSKPLLLDREMT